MAASAKKNKKKGKTLTLNDFLAVEKGGNAPPSYPSTKTTSWADETDDLDGDVSTSWHTEEDSYRAPPIDRSILPTAPRAAREPNIDRSRLPRGPPYTAFLGNLPYDVSEESIKDFFRGLAISAVRLPREASNPERLKGFGYAEFDDVDSILRALSLNEENLGNRRIRVDIADQSNDKERDSGSMMGRDRDRGRGMDLGGPDKTDSDWRARPSSEQDDGPRKDDSYGDRSQNRFESDRFRDAPRRDDRYDSGRDRYGGRDSYDDRDRRDRYDDRGSRDYDRGGYESRGGGQWRSSGFKRDDERKDGDQEEKGSIQRPRLNLKPRSIPKEEEQIGSLPPQSRTTSIFGAAKPVDTAAKEREMEERLKKEQERLQKQLEEDKNKGSERRPRDRDPSWRSEGPSKEREYTGSESSRAKGSRSRDGNHSENEILSGQEDEPISPASPLPSSNQGVLPVKVMPAPPPKENAWAKRSTGGGANEGEVPPQVSPTSRSDPTDSRKDVRGEGGPRVASEPKENEETTPAVLPTDRTPESVMYVEDCNTIEVHSNTYVGIRRKQFSSASKYAALLIDGDQGDDNNQEE